MCIHKHGQDWEEGPWEFHDECPDYLQVCDELDEAKSTFKQILQFLYADKNLNVAELEHYLIELSDTLRVGFPDNKNINVMAKC